MDEYRRLQLAQSGALDHEVSEDPTITTTDLDSFLTGVYRYYKEGGLRATIARSVSNVAASSFTFGLSFVVLLMVDWSSVIACTSEETCSKLSLFYSSAFFPLTFYRFIVLIQLIPLGLYAVGLSIIACIARVREALRISRFFRESLFVQEDDELNFVKWSDIVERISRYQATSASPLCIVQDTLSPIEIHSIIMRTDNVHLSAMKEWYSLYRSDSWMMLPLQSRAIQWCIQHGVISWLFDDRYRIRDGALATVGVRIQFVGLLTLALMGPLAIFAVFLIVIIESDEVRSNKASLFEKEWTVLSKTVLRHYSEPDIWLCERLEGAAKSRIASQFSESLVSERSRKSILRTVKFLSAGILSVLAAIALVQDSALLYMTVGGKSLLFIFALCSGALAISAGLDAPPGSKQTCEEKIGCGILLMSHIHSNFDQSLPPSCNVNGCQLSQAREIDMISNEFLRKFYRPKIFNIFFEFVGILSLPFFFLFVFPNTLGRVIAASVPLVRSEHLGDFSARGCLDGARALSEQYHEMVGGNVVQFSSLRNMEKVNTLLMLSKVYQLGTARGIVGKIFDFKKACCSSSLLTQAVIKVDRCLIDSDWFWYALLRELTMSEGGVSLLRMRPDLIRLGQEGLSFFSSLPG